MEILNPVSLRYYWTAIYGSVSLPLVGGVVNKIATAVKEIFSVSPYLAHESCWNARETLSAAAPGHRNA